MRESLCIYCLTYTSTHTHSHSRSHNCTDNVQPSELTVSFASSHFLLLINELNRKIRVEFHFHSTAHVSSSFVYALQHTSIHPSIYRSILNFDDVWKCEALEKIRSSERGHRFVCIDTTARVVAVAKKIIPFRFIISQSISQVIINRQHVAWKLFNAQSKSRRSVWIKVERPPPSPTTKVMISSSLTPFSCPLRTRIHISIVQAYGIMVSIGLWITQAHPDSACVLIWVCIPIRTKHHIYLDSDCEK